MRGERAIDVPGANDDSARVLRVRPYRIRIEGPACNCTHMGFTMSRVTAIGQYSPVLTHGAARGRAIWLSHYLRWATIVDCACALAASFIAFGIRLETRPFLITEYLTFSLLMPVVWLAAVKLTGAYDPRFIGTGSDEYHRILNAGVSLTAGIAVFSFVAKLDLARSYVVIALPCATAFDLIARYGLRKRLHKLRRLGSCMQRTVVVGHSGAVAELVNLLKADTHHGLSIVAACLTGTQDSHEAGAQDSHEIAGIPVCGGIGSVPMAVETFAADTVALLACSEINGLMVRDIAWELEKTRTDICVAPALIDVAGPRATIRPVAGLPLLHVDHPQLSGAKQVLKGFFDRISAATALIVLLPVFVVIALVIRFNDGGRIIFRQTRIGKDGNPFTVYKFRTMVEDAEHRRWKAQLARQNEADGPLFKLRNDPRVTKAGAWLRHWSLDELPQLLNVLLGEMSLVGPRPALPEEVATYAYRVRRRLAVKPGMTGLWQVSGRSNLSWEESVRLDIRYVENWSITLDVHILWRTLWAVVHRFGAY
jgi:exopolysaccharide biosynthesis polyprenyl glycosylphosphotransferase